jgi:SAM-dependent methyltransferase
MNRVTGIPELLDGPLDDERALIGNLRDFRRLNRLDGGTDLSRRAIGGLADDGRPIESMVDVGTGGADIPASLLADAARTGRPLNVTATDNRPEVLAAARLARPGLAGIAGLKLEVADGRALPYPDASFDVAHASMVVHHLSPEDAVAFLRELRRVARRGIVLNDLVRGRAYWLGAWIVVHALAESRFTRHDGPLSVRRAYSRGELQALVRDAGLQPVRTVVGFAGHRVAIAAR